MEKENKKLLLSVGLIFFLVVIGAALFWHFYQKTPLIFPSTKCGPENCHGLNIKCGFNIPDVCTEVYEIGDFCRQYAKCQVVDGKCELIKDNKFDYCKNCVEKCLEDFKNDSEGLFECEANCR